MRRGAGARHRRPALAGQRPPQRRGAALRRRADLRRRLAAPSRSRRASASDERSLGVARRSGGHPTAASRRCGSRVSPRTPLTAAMRQFAHRPAPDARTVADRGRGTGRRGRPGRPGARTASPSGSWRPRPCQASAAITSGSRGPQSRRPAAPQPPAMLGTPERGQVLAVQRAPVQVDHRLAGQPEANIAALVAHRR